MDVLSSAKPLDISSLQQEYISRLEKMDSTLSEKLDILNDSIKEKCDKISDSVKKELSESKKTTKKIVNKSACSIINSFVFIFIISILIIFLVFAILFYLIKCRVYPFDEVLTPTSSPSNAKEFLSVNANSFSRDISPDLRDSLINRQSIATFR